MSESLKHSLLGITLFLFWTGMTIIIPFFFEDALIILTTGFGLGWVFGTILLRLASMVFFGLALHSIFKIIKRTSNIRLWLSLAIAAIPGFFISFAVYPIYDIDYGMLNDNLEIPPVSELNRLTQGEYEHEGAHQVIAFLDVGCNHCEVACRKLAAAQLKNPELDIHIFFSEEKKYVDHFLERNNGLELTHHYLASQHQFINFAGFEFPSIFVVGPDETTLYHWVGSHMNYTALDYLNNL